MSEPLSSQSKRKRKAWRLAVECFFEVYWILAVAHITGASSVPYEFAVGMALLGLVVVCATSYELGQMAA